MQITSGRRRRQPDITPVVFFSTQNPDLPQGVTYVTSRSDSLDAIDSAAEWLDQYVRTYDGEIITNFDQQRQIFKDAPFSLERVMDGSLDSALLKNRFNIQNARIICKTIQSITSEKATMNKIEVKLGNGNVFHGDFAVAKTIENSFNKVAKADIDESMKSLLQDLAGAVGRMQEQLDQDDAIRVSRSYETLSQEATSATPDRRWWEVSMDGLRDAAQKVGEIGMPVLKILESIAKYLPAA